MKSLKLLFTASLVSLFSGCATYHNAAFDKDTSSINTEEKSVFILPAEITNIYKSSYQPAREMILTIEEPGAKNDGQRYKYIVEDEEFETTDDGGVGVEFRGELAPGDYILKGISGISTGFLVLGSFSLPMNYKITIPDKSVVHFSKISAKIRKKETKSEFSAGPAIPLIDQSVAGFSGGTFDTKVSDPSEEELNRLKEKYKSLENVQLIVINLPPYDRSEFDN